MTGRVVVLIPARLESSRLPGKPLKMICDIPMVVHVAKRSMLAASVSSVVVCTDSIDILHVCEKHGINVCLTRSLHQNGTERIAEAAEQIGLDDECIVIDVQGDEPFVKPEYIQQVADFVNSTKYTCVVPHQFTDDYNNINRVKIVCSGDRVLYFSRKDIPCHFGSVSQPLKKHLSIVGFRLSGLNEFASSPPTPLELLERIELMRLLELGVPIGTFLQDGVSLSVDTPDDYELACRMMERDELFNTMITQGTL